MGWPGPCWGAQVLGLELNPYLPPHQVGWGLLGFLCLPGRGLVSGCSGPGSLMVGQPWPLGLKWSPGEETESVRKGPWIWSQTWEPLPATPWPLPAQLGQFQPSSCSSQKAFESAWILSLTSISKPSTHTFNFTFKLCEISDEHFLPSPWPPALRPLSLQAPSPQITSTPA